MAEEQRKEIRLADLVTHLKLEGLDEAVEKLEKIKSLMSEISALSKNLFK